MQKKKRRTARRRGRGRLAAIVLALAVALVALAAVLASDRLRAAEDARYPMQYTELIRSRAAEAGLEPAYVAAVILAESGYRADAVSSENAQGLMQILPSTGEWIAGKFDESYAEGCLFDPDTNVRYGCWYLGFLMRRYDGDKRASSAAYHSGQGTVDEWLKNPAYSADGRTLDVISGSNAATYVDRVLKYYEEYARLYAQDNQAA